MMHGRQFVALLLVGGAGTRLWPLSTEERPKQFLQLFGGRSLLQGTVARLAACEVDEIVIVTAAPYAAMVAEQIAELGIGAYHLLVEPCRRDSAAAITAGMAWIERAFGADPVVAVLPSDHFIPDAADFARALEKGAALAVAGWLVTFGIRPTAPTTEYGYIQRGDPLTASGPDGGCKVVRFHEKPRRDLAEAYLRDGSYDWNSGIFVFAAPVFAAEAARHMPDIVEAVTAAVAAGRQEAGRFELDLAAFQRARKTSIDYALLEKSDRVGVIPVGFAWHDIGNWGSAYAAFSDGSGANYVLGETVLDDVAGAIVVADQVKVVVCGLDDVVVVASPRGTFVASRSKAAEIKRLLGG